MTEKKKLSIWDAPIGGGSKAREQHVCTKCGHVGYPEMVSPGNGCVALLLFAFFIIPGVIYVAWMMTSEKLVFCRKCGGKNTMIPAESERGRQLLNAHGAPVTSVVTSAPEPGFCRSCGKYFRDAAAAFCPFCGARQDT